MGSFFLAAGFRLLFSFHDRSAVLEETPGSKWNCSVPYWADFKQHFPCNLQVDCLAGEPGGRMVERWTSNARVVKVILTYMRDDELLCEFQCPDNCTCYGTAFICRRPFPASSYPDLRYVDASSTGMAVRDFANSSMLVFLDLTACGITQLDNKSAQIACAVVWVVGLVLASVPLLPVTSHWQFYSQTGICIPLPITRNEFPGHGYSFSIFIVLNLVLFLFIAAGQVMIFWSVRSNRLPAKETSKHAQDALLASRLFTTAMSDFLCWFPIGVLGLIAATGTPVSGEVNVAMAIIVMPINSALNPFLYTLNVALEIDCESGANISLPFPMRSPGLVRLTVRNCRLLDTYADVGTPAESLRDTLQELDMQNCTWHNNITKVSLAMFRDWARVSDFSVDVRNNPVDCSCQIGEFLADFKNEKLWKVGRYRREVRILLFTRLHVLLPCGFYRVLSKKPADDKQYDAFVAYAHEDSDWRDFTPGKPIINNIVENIAASRHTIVILTTNFVRSFWGMEELQQAYLQSLEERRRHLVLVVLEDVPQSDMTPVLRRCCKTFTYLHVNDKLFWDR
nr:hypothetical protein BaRGS_029666 [Batillaria attramentaria]